MNKGTPTIYRGIRYKSKLEAQFATWADQTQKPRSQLFYERESYVAADGRRCSPDFVRVGQNRHETFIELKQLDRNWDSSNAGWHRFREVVQDEIERLEIVHEHLPQASLNLIYWQWDNSGRAEVQTSLKEACVFFKETAKSEWWVSLPGMGFYLPLPSPVP